MTPSRHACLAIGDLLDILPDAVIMVDAGSRITYANPALSTLLGYSAAELLAQPLSLLVPPEQRERHATLVARFRREGASTMMGSRPVLHAVHRSGRLVPVSISLCNLCLDERDSERVSVAVIHDVSAMHTHLDRATAQAETDTLTGLGNRLRLSRRMHALLAGARPFSLLSLDVESIGPPDERRGDALGDDALRIVGRRLQTVVRESDLVARVGRTEFMLLLDTLDDAALLRERALAVHASLARPLRIGASTGSLGVHIGGAISPRHGAAEQALLAAADQALGRARHTGEGYLLAAA